MKRLKGVLEGLGLLFFVLGASAMDSEGAGILIAIAMFFGGIFLAFIGQKLPETFLQLKGKFSLLKGGRYYEQSHINR